MAPSSTEHPYRLIQEIRNDEGGAIYTAHHGVLQRTETLRILPSPRTDEQSFVSRLREVSRAMAMLSHPHVAPVYGYGRLDDGRFFLAMEYLEGDSLGTLIDKEGAQSEGLTRRLLYQLASAIRCAHEQQIVHRHLGPSSIMLVDQDGVAPNLKVRDFGLATILESTSRAESSPSMAGTLYGNPAYIAPERATGAAGNPSVDIYSFGCVAHTLMTGQPPVAGMPFSNVAATAHSGELVGLVTRCLEREPSARFSDGTALCAALQELDGFYGEPTWQQGFPASSPTTIGENAHTIRRGRFPMVKTELDAGDRLDGAGGAAKSDHRKFEDLLETAEAALTTGPEALACLAELRRSTEALKDHERARQQLHSLGEATYRSFRRKESRIRFEIGELSFRLGTNRSADERARVEAKLNELTEELVRTEHLHTRELQAITSREVDLAAARHGLEENRAEQWDAFAKLVATAQEN